MSIILLLHIVMLAFTFGHVELLTVDYHSIDIPIVELNNHTLREVFEGGIYSATPQLTNGTLNGITFTRSTYPIITMNGTAIDIQVIPYMINILPSKNIYLIYDNISGTNEASFTNQSGGLIKTNINDDFTLKMIGNTQIYYTLTTGKTAVNHTSKITLIDLDILGISALTVEQMDYYFEMYQENISANDVTYVANEMDITDLTYILGFGFVWFIIIWSIKKVVL